MCKPMPAGALMGGLFIGGNVIILVGILIYNGILDITEGEIDYARYSDHTSIPRLRAVQHQAGKQCLFSITLVLTCILT